jgi:hypothetical protein
VPPLARPADASAAGENPHRFHENRSEIAHDIARLASTIAHAASDGASRSR